eukprot:CAMPEP_0184038858 /NCGR_PEP_ID=MMETSP0955-20130417/49671_1 /TAXON_ID=627963 /ORGANISM="Aplanochytrium sp, Strain PBS07" /LENGTH=326 /DNA_ID=CAMNT_0026327719 /DNA_START=38 /DNA_END=1015 /DNA_ORIENTATION=-
MTSQRVGLLFELTTEGLDINNRTLRLSTRQNDMTTSEDLDDTGLAVWDGGIVLAKFLEQEIGPELLKKIGIVELGSGTGICGIAAALCGANVILTDLDYALPLIRSNIERNKESMHEEGGHAVEICLDWTEPYNIKRVLEPLSSNYIIVAADCLWKKEYICPFFKTLKCFLRNGSMHPTYSNKPDGLSHQYCCCQMSDLQENDNAEEAIQSAAMMGFETFSSNADLKNAKVLCSEATWACRNLNHRSNQINETERETTQSAFNDCCSFALLAYSYRDDEVYRAMMETLQSDFCFSKVPPHRSPWTTFNFGNKFEPNFSDETSSPVW